MMPSAAPAGTAEGLAIINAMNAEGGAAAISGAEWTAAQYAAYEQALGEGSTVAEAGAIANGAEIPGGPTLGGAATVAAIIAAADFARQKYGQLDRPYEDRGAFAKLSSTPAMGPTTMALDVLGAGSDSNFFGGFANSLARAEEKVIGEPLDKLFAGDIPGGVGQFAEEAVSTPGRIVDTVVDTVSGGTVICTELHRQGLLDGEVWETDKKYRGMVSAAMYEGYRILADPVVSLMQKSRLFTLIFAPFALRTAREMAHRVNRDIEGSWLGGLVLGVFQPICEKLGKRRSADIADPVIP
jgi:hypothetical protein